MQQLPQGGLPAWGPGLVGGPLFVCLDWAGWKVGWEKVPPELRPGSTNHTCKLIHIKTQSSITISINPFQRYLKDNTTVWGYICFPRDDQLVSAQSENWTSVAMMSWLFLLAKCLPGQQADLLSSAGSIPLHFHLVRDLYNLPQPSISLNVQPSI